jgi:hypothetical protein
LRVAEGLSKISTMVAAAGIVDIAEGAALLEKSQDVAIQSEVVRYLGEEDLNHAMGIAAIAGQLTVASDIVHMREMPVLADFLEAKGHALHQLAVESVVKFAAGRAVANSMIQTAAQVGELGIGEMAEGAARLDVAERGAAASEALALGGAEKVLAGAVAVEAAEELRQAGQDLALEGVADVAAGAERIGQAEALDVTAGALANRAG